MLSTSGTATDQVAHADDAVTCTGLTLTGPSSGKKNPYDDLNYTLVVNDAGGRSVTLDIASGLTLDESSLAANKSGRVKAYSYDKSSNKVTIVFKDDAQATQLALTATVDSDAKKNITSDTEYTTKVDGCSDVQNTTRVTGTLDYSPTITAESAIGSTNRTVSYYFNAKTNGWSSNESKMTNLTSHSQVFTDTLPAGAIVKEYSVANPNGLKGKWTNDGNTWTWTGDNVYGPSASVLDTSERAIYLVVEYPADKFPENAQPPENTVSLHTESKGGVDTDDSSATAQGDAFVDPTGGEQIKLLNKMTDSGDTDANGNESENAYNGDYSTNSSKGVIAASYTNDDATATLKNLVLTDDASYTTANAAFFNHAYLYKVDVNFNTGLRSANNTFTFQYKTSDAPDVWKTYDLGDRNSTQSNNGRFYLRAVPSGSTSSWNFYEEGVTDTLDLARGTHLVGWKVTVLPEDGKGLESESQIKVKPQYVISGLPLDTTDTSATDAEPTLTNTAEASGVSNNTENELKVSDPTTVHVNQAVPVYTRISSNGSINMSEGAGTTSYKACIQNLDPHGTAYDTNMSIVLPEGLVYDAATGVKPTTVNASPANIRVPTVGNGLTIDATKYVNANKQQVINFKFTDLPATLTQNESWTGSYCYTIPVVATTQAVVAAQGNPVTASSWAWVDGDKYQNAPITPTWNGAVTAQDKYGLADGAQQGVPAYSSASSNINISGGGLNLTGQVSRSQSNPTWKLETAVDSPSKQTWQIQVFNSFSVDLSDAVVFDRLPYAGDANGSDFDVKLSGAATVTDADGNTVDSSAAKVEYSKNATAANDGDWSTSYVDGATAIRVTIPRLKRYQSYKLKLPTSIGEHLANGAKAINGSSATFKYVGATGLSVLTATSSKAEINVAAGSFSVATKITGSGAGLVSKDAQFSIVYTATVPAGQTYEGILKVGNRGAIADSPAYPDGTIIRLSENPPDSVAGATWNTAFFSQDEVTIGAGKTATVTLTNQLAKN